MGKFSSHYLTDQLDLWFLFLYRDCLDSDIVGCNLYQRYLDRKQRRNSNIESEWEESSSKDEFDSALPESRNIPEGTKITKQTVESCMGILVCTGVYKPETCPEPGTDDGEEKYPGHRDFSKNMELYKPEVILSDCEAAIEFIFEREGMAS